MQESDIRAPAGRGFLSMLSRYIYILLMGGWMGGFTFYALIVIPTAQIVLGGERDVGFITQQVTRWLNLIGFGTLLFLLVIELCEWKSYSRLDRWLLGGTWLVMAGCLPALYVLHLHMDTFLEAQGHKIHEYSRFDSVHDVYLVFATIQWVAALTNIWQSLAVWRRQDAVARV